MFTLGRPAKAGAGEDGGRGNSDRGSWLRLENVLELTDADSDRTGAMIEVETERGGTMREDAEGRDVVDVFVGREPGLESVRVRGRATPVPAIFALAEVTGGRDSAYGVVRVTEGGSVPAV